MTQKQNEIVKKMKNKEDEKEELEKSLTHQLVEQKKESEAQLNQKDWVKLAIFMVI